MGIINTNAQCPEIVRGPYLQPGSGAQATESIVVRWRTESNTSMKICFSEIGQNDFGNCETIYPSIQEIVIPYSGYNEYSLKTVYNYQYEIYFNFAPFNDGNTYEYRIEKNACTLTDNSLASGVLHQYPTKGTVLDESLDI